MGAFIYILSAGNATLAKNAGVNEVGQKLVDGLMSTSLNGIKNRTTEKVNGKTVIKKDNQQ